MTHRSVIAIVLAVAAIVATPVLAQHGPHGRQAGPGGPEHMALGPVVQILHDLDLNDTQRSQIHEIVQRYRDLELAPRAKDLMQARHAHQLNVWDPSAAAADLDTTRAVVA